MNRNTYRRARLLAMTSDMIALLVAYAVASTIVPADPRSLSGAVALNSVRYMLAIALLLPVAIGIFSVRGLYRHEIIFHGTALVASVAESSSVVALLALAGSYVIGSDVPSRDWFLVAWIATFCLTALFRRLLLAVTRRARRRRPWRVLIAGASQVGARVAVHERRHAHVLVVGFVDDYLPLGVAVGEERVLARPLDLLALAASERIDEVLVVQGALSQESYDRLLRQAYTTPEMPPLTFVPSTSGEMLLQLLPAHREGLAIALPELKRIGGLARVAKGALDRGIALAVVVALAPLLFVAAVWSVMHGRPLFRGTPMVGQGGKRFPRWSLAAWWEVDPEVDGTLHLYTDASSQSIVQLMRKLPRAVNVLRGDMSLVGPRPILESNLSLYHEWAGVLLAVKPGIFGPWLVLHGDTQLSPEEELLADLDYVRDYDPGKDLQILAGSAARLARRCWRGVTLSVTNRAVRTPLPDAGAGQSAEAPGSIAAPNARPRG